VDIYQRKIEVESAKEVLLETILKNKENLDTNMIAKVIKDYVKNYEEYNLEKRETLDLISGIEK